MDSAAFAPHGRRTRSASRRARGSEFRLAARLNRSKERRGQHVAPARPRRSPPPASSALRRNRRRGPANSRARGPSASAAAVRSSSHDAITLPRRQTSAIVGADRNRIDSARDRAAAWSRRRARGALADVGVLQDVESLGVGRHQAVLDAVVHHLHEVARAARAAVQIAALGGSAAPLAPGVAASVPTPGASVAKIGSSRRTTSASPPIIRQYPRSRPSTPPLVPTVNVVQSPARRAAWRGGCRRGSTSCRRRSPCRRRRAAGTRSSSVGHRRPPRAPSARWRAASQASPTSSSIASAPAAPSPASRLHRLGGCVVHHAFDGRLA